MTMDDLQTTANSALARQAFSQLLGAELVSISPGNAELALTITDSLKQQHGFLHGGVVGYLADNALTFAGGSVLGKGISKAPGTSYIGKSSGGHPWCVMSSMNASRARATRSACHIDEMIEMRRPVRREEF
jgi:acyl-coenzyme A thioesterase PaaI-like protein